MADDKNFTIDTDDTVMFKERKRHGRLPNIPLPRVF